MTSPVIRFTTDSAKEGIDMLELGTIEGIPVFLIGKSEHASSHSEQRSDSAESPTRRFSQNV